jgi:hypothetical protein
VFLKGPDVVPGLEPTYETLLLLLAASITLSPPHDHCASNVPLLNTSEEIRWPIGEKKSDLWLPVERQKTTHNKLFKAWVLMAVRRQPRTIRSSASRQVERFELSKDCLVFVVSRLLSFIRTQALKRRSRSRSSVLTLLSLQSRIRTCDRSNSSSRLSLGSRFG